MPILSDILVSIIVPFYNVDPYFRRCLDSIVNQTYENLEIILVNDCSPDNSIDIAREYAQKDSRIIIIEHEKSLHVGGARNTGLVVARGEYVWFIDSDDMISSPYAVDHLLSIAENNHADVVLFNAQTLHEDGAVSEFYNLYPYVSSQVFNEHRPFYPFFYDVVVNNIRTSTYFDAEVWNKFFRISFVRQYQFTFLEHTVHQDVPILMILPLAQRVVQVPYSYYYYYQRQGSTMNSPPRADYFDHFNRITLQLQELYNQYWPDFLHKEQIIPAIMLKLTIYHTKKSLIVLDFELKTVWLLNFYNFMKNNLVSELSFDDVYLLLTRYCHNDEYVRLLIESFSNPDLCNENKVDYVSFFLNIKQKEAEEKKSSLKKILLIMKNILKSFLPYGVIRLFQLIKNKYLNKSS
ncbi:glycosyltransferase [Entomospira entomophila]|uniref:Glycosyltransferase n=1 Tax=Entomospira entomophila TaxID=2719988 RepID=A0A968GBV9_9SPIO|nr:glycosyltransferase family 2 protein [Entomospira entomophilus]NIZ40089.1 glycosyltransferase [Entomospira entomophilus]WDI35650.1 glycosyltransferase [Entomospira entomophilus]